MRSIGTIVRRGVRKLSSTFASGRRVRGNRAIFDAVEPRRLFSTTINAAVYVDDNKNGTIEAVERSAVAGQTVFADYNYNGMLDAGEPSAITPASGLVTLNVQNQSFALRLKVAGSYQQSAPFGNAFYYELKNGIPSTYASTPAFGVQSTIVANQTTLSGYAYVDANSNGQRDPSEKGIPNAGIVPSLVYLDYNDDQIHEDNEPSSLIDPNTGAYTISNIRTQDGYRLRLYYDRTAYRLLQNPYGGEMEDRAIVHLTANAANTGFDFGATTQGGTIAVSSFSDFNHDGQLQDGETRVGHAWYDLNSNGGFDLGEPEPFAVVSGGHPGGASYLASFGALHLPFGTYQIALDTSTSVGGDATADYLLQATISADSPLASVTFIVPTAYPTQKVVAHVYADANGNGKIDASETTGVSGQTVFADYNYNGALDVGEDSALTDANGDAVVSAQLKSFQLVLAPSIGQVQSAPANKRVYYYELRNGALVGYGSTFGVKANVTSATGTVNIGSNYEDGNGNGKLDRGEANIGLELWIDANLNGIHDANEPSIDYYNRGGLGQGPYDGSDSGAVTLPLGTYRFAVRSINSLGATVVTTRDVTISSANQIIDVDFPIAAVKSRVEGYVFLDANRNGVRDAGEMNGGGLGNGATVWADYNGNGVIDAGEPTAPGFASDGFFSILVANSPFTLTLKTPNGYIQTLPSGNAGRGENFNSISVASNQDFGIAPAVPNPTSTLTTHVYNDTNKDGKIDVSEAKSSNGAAGQTVFADYNYNRVLDPGEDLGTTDATGTATLNTQLKPFQLVLKPGTDYTQSAPSTNGVYYYEVRNGAIVGYGSTFGVTATTVTPPTTGSGTIYVNYFADFNGDGVFTGGGFTNGVFDPGIDGVYTPKLGAAASTAFIDINHNNVLDAGDITLSATSQTGGITYDYFFDALAPGTYHVVLNNGLAAGESIYGGATRDITITAGSNVDNGGVANLSVPVEGVSQAQVSVSVFYDANQSGYYDPGEAGPLDSEIGRIYADLNYNGKYDDGEPATFISHYGSPPLLLPAGHGYSIRVAYPDGTNASFPYGASDRYITYATPGLYTLTLPIVPRL